MLHLLAAGGVDSEMKLMCLTDITARMQPRVSYIDVIVVRLGIIHSVDCSTCRTRNSITETRK